MSWQGGSDSCSTFPVMSDPVCTTTSFGGTTTVLEEPEDRGGGTTTVLEEPEDRGGGTKTVFGGTTTVFDQDNTENDCDSVCFDLKNRVRICECINCCDDLTKRCSNKKKAALDFLRFSGGVDCANLHLSNT